MKTTAWWCGVLCAALMITACDDERAAMEGDDAALWRSTSVPLPCPSGATPVSYDGDADAEVAITTDDFWLGTGTCGTVAGWSETEAAIERVKQQAIEECEGDAVSFSCPEPCILLTRPGTCTITSSKVTLVQENPPVPPGTDWSCDVKLEATAEATDYGACLQPIEPEPPQESER